MEKSKGVIESSITDEETLNLSASESPNHVNLSVVSINNSLEVQSDCDETMILVEGKIFKTRNVDDYECLLPQIMLMAALLIDIRV